MDLMDTSKSFRGLKISFYAITRVPLKTRNVFDVDSLMLKLKLKTMHNACCFIP